MNEDALVAVLRVVALVLASLCAFFAWEFVWLYRRTTWRNTPEGGHLLRFTAALAVTFTLSVAFALVPVPAVARGVITVLVFAAIAIELRRRVHLFRAAQREHDNP